MTSEDVKHQLIITSKHSKTMWTLLYNSHTCWTVWTPGSRSPGRLGHPCWPACWRPGLQCDRSVFLNRGRMDQPLPSPRSCPSCQTAWHALAGCYAREDRKESSDGQIKWWCSKWYFLHIVYSSGIHTILLQFVSLVWQKEMKCLYLIFELTYSVTL